jgi:hypothetical protein
MEKDPVKTIMGNDDVCPGAHKEVITTHLLYLSNIDLLSQKEREYFITKYFPWLAEMYQDKSFVDHYTINKDGSRTRDFRINTGHQKVIPQGVFKHFRCSTAYTPKELKLDFSPKTVYGVYVAKSFESFLRGRYSQLSLFYNYTIDFFKGSIQLYEHPENKIFKVLGIGTEGKIEHYSIIVDYLTNEPTAHNVGPFNTGGKVE